MPNEQGINPNRDPVGAAALKWQDDPSGDRTRSLLSMIDVNVKPEVVRGWSKDQRREAEAYAHSVLLDHAHPTLSAPQAMPDFVAEAAHPPQVPGEPVRYPDDIGPRWGNEDERPPSDPDILEAARGVIQMLERGFIPPEKYVGAAAEAWNEAIKECLGSSAVQNLRVGIERAQRSPRPPATETPPQNGTQPAEGELARSPDDVAVRRSEDESPLHCPQCGTTMIRIEASSEPEGIRRDALCHPCQRLYAVHKSGLVPLRHPSQDDPLPWARMREAARKQLNERLDVLVRAIHRAIRDFAGDSAVMADTYLHGAQRLTEIGLLALRHAAYCAVNENGVSYVTATQVHRIAAFLEKSPRTFGELEATFRSAEDAEIAHILDKLVAAALQD